MNLITRFGLLALVPAAFNVSSAAALTVPVCTGDGQVRSMTLPLDGPQLPGGDGAMCCAKGCHAGSRKRLLHKFAPEQ